MTQKPIQRAPPTWQDIEALRRECAVLSQEADRLRGLEDTARRLVYQVVSDFNPEGTLSEQLTVLAEVAKRVPGISGAMIVALDDSHDPIAAGFADLEPIWPQGDTHLVTLNRLADSLRELPDQQVPEGWLQPGPYYHIRFYCIPQSGPRAGYLLTAHDSPGNDDTPKLLEVLAHLIHLPIRDAIQREALERLRKLRDLAKHLSPRTLNLKSILHQIREIFAADTVTLWLEAEKRLYLSASTDERLTRETRPRKYYDRGQGLTGGVWALNRTISVINTHDHESISKLLEKPYSGPTHRETDSQNKEYTQFLGVPVRAAGDAIGVLRLVRHEGAFHFSKDEEAALEFFCELLGLRVADALRRQILETIWNSNSVALIASHNKNITLVNPGAERLFSNHGTQLVGLPAGDLYMPGDFSRVEAELRKTIRSTGHVTPPMVVYFKDARGEPSPAELDLHLIQNDLVHPSLQYTLGVASDLSEQYSGAAGFAQLRQILNEAKIVFVRTLESGALIFSNEAEEHITGYTRAELMNNRQELWMDRQDRKRLFTSARNAGGEIVRHIIKFRHKNGNPLHVWAQVRLFKEGDREILEGVYEDVSARLKLQDWLDLPSDRWIEDEALTQAVERDAQQRLDFQVTLGHQMKSPLLALIKNLKRLRQEPTLNDLAREHVSSRIAETMAAYYQVGSFFALDDLLLRSDLPAEALRRVNLIQTILHVVDDLNATAQQNRLRIEVDRASIRPHEELQAHPALLKQVVSNLLDNALKYSHPHSTVFIRAARNHGGPGFEVSSRGAPVPQAERERLFTKGFRGSNGLGLAEGSGLGLWFADRVVRLHGGSIRYEAEFIDGHPRNTFVVRLCRTPGAKGVL